MKTSSKFLRISDVLLLIGALASIIWSVYFALVTISIPYQIELREGSAPLTTEILLRGGNPFTLDNQPLAMNNYGIGYNLVVWPFAWAFGNTLFVHRCITFLFIIGSAVLGFIAIYKMTGSKPLALACAAFIMNGLIGQGGIGAFPTSMGVFLFLISVFLPFFRKFDRFSLVISVLTCLIAFYTKAYFVLGFGIVLSYLFLFVSKGRGVFYAGMFALFLLAFTQWVRLIFPLYFVNTLIGNVSNTFMSSAHLWSQLKALFFIFYPVLTACLFYGAWDLVEGRGRGVLENIHGMRLSDLDMPVFAKSVNYFAYAFFLCLFVFVLILGRHVGSYLNYAFQLLVPTFFIWFLQLVSVREKLKLLVSLAVLFTLFKWQQNLLAPAMLQQKDSSEWAQVFEYVHASSVTLNSPAVASELIIRGQMPMDSGQTSYFYAVQPFSKTPLSGVSYDELHDDGFRYVLLLDRMIEKQRFDLVITTKEKANFYHDKLLQNSYYPVDEITVEMPQTSQQWTLVFWKPLIK